MELFNLGIKMEQPAAKAPGDPVAVHCSVCGTGTLVAESARAQSYLLLRRYWNRSFKISAGPVLFGENALDLGGCIRQNLLMI